MATQSDVVIGCYERFVLGHEAVAIKGELGGKKSDEKSQETDLGATDDKKAFFWTQRFAVKAHQGPVKCIKSKGGLVASGGDDDCVRIYDLVNGKDLGTLVQHEGSVTCLDMFMSETANRPSHLFSGGVDGLINVWRVKDFKAMTKLRGHKRRVNSLAVHSSGKMALSCDQDRNLCMWNLLKGRVSYKTRLDVAFEELLFSQMDNKYVGRTRSSIIVRDLEDPEFNKKIDFGGQGQGGVTSFCLGAEYEVVLGSGSGQVCTFDLRSCKKSIELDAHTKRVKGVAVLKGHRTVSTSSEGDLKMWDSRNAKEPLAVKQLGVRTTCLAACNLL